MKKANPLLNYVRSVLPQARLPAEAGLYERNCELLDALEDIFSYSKMTSPLELKSLISEERVRLVHEAVASIFPPDLDFEVLIEPKQNHLRAYFISKIDPSTILQDIVRYSLYSDQIYILSPFMNPISLKPEYNPVFNPAIYRQYTLKIVTSLVILEPWIRSRVVQIIPDPGDANYAFKIKTWDQAEKRLASYSKEDRNKVLNNQVAKEQMLEDISRLITSAPERLLKQQIKATFPEKTDKEIHEIFTVMKEQSAQDPLALPEVTNQLLMSVGGNLEHSLFISQCFSAFPYTSADSQWKELSLATDASMQPWSPLTRAFQKLDFTFLDSADVAFASKLREEGRLQPFRNFLRKTWNHSKEADSWSDETARAYADELVDEVNSAKSEWSKIQQELIKWGAGATASFLGTSSLAVGKIEIAIPSAAFFVKSLGELRALALKTKDFSKNMPAAIFMDLENADKKNRKNLRF